MESPPQCYVHRTSLKTYTYTRRARKIYSYFTDTANGESTPWSGPSLRGRPGFCHIQRLLYSVPLYYSVRMHTHIFVSFLVLFQRFFLSFLSPFPPALPLPPSQAIHLNISVNPWTSPNSLWRVIFFSIFGRRGSFKGRPDVGHFSLFQFLVGS